MADSQFSGRVRTLGGLGSDKDENEEGEEAAASGTAGDKAGSLRAKRQAVSARQRGRDPTEQAEATDALQSADGAGEEVSATGADPDVP